MKRFALRDVANESAGTLALLECFERPRTFYIELSPHVDPWDLPFVLHEFAQRNEPTVDSQWALRWVRSRLVPTERQNLGEVLRTNNLQSYDELRLLELTEGRCSQDECYLVPLREDQLPAWYAERREARMTDVFALDGLRLLACFCDGEVLLCDMGEHLANSRTFSHVLADEELFGRATLQAGGHGVRWGKTLLVSSHALRNAGTSTGLVASDIAALGRQAVLDTAEAARIMDCSRQNVSDLVRRGRLTPIKTTTRGPLFLRGDVYARLT
ncbi:MAG: helix-turn-helix domain-containing protein [Atopobiaceae bacterium]|nr:helix-turn-helix domain-containing protein [Atopobiaceae bacterium]